MKRVLLLAAILAAAASSRAAELSVAGYRFYGSWRSLAHQLPGAHRFLDRLDLTEEQQKALGKVHKDWLAERREAYALARKGVPPLSAKDGSDPQKRTAYYERLREALRKAQVPPPVALANDILSEEQQGKLAEADKVIEAWDKWLAERMTKSEAELDEVLGPASESQPVATQYAYTLFGSLVKGGELLGRLRLSEEQDTGLQDLRKEYYAEYSAMMGPLYQSLGPLGRGKVPHASSMAVRVAIAKKGGAQVKEKYRRKLQSLLTKEQQNLLSMAHNITQERDRAIWDRYSQYIQDLSAILPPPTPARNPGTNTKAEQPKRQGGQ